MSAGPGETFDLEYRPAAPGLSRLEVLQRTGVWKVAPLPIRVEPWGLRRTKRLRILVLGGGGDEV